MKLYSFIGVEICYSNNVKNCLGVEPLQTLDSVKIQWSTLIKIKLYY